jgi:hypothetical protein
MKRPASIKESFSVIFRFYKILGFFPFSRDQPNGDFKTTRKDQLILFLQILFHCLMILYFSSTLCVLMRIEKTKFLAICWQACYIYLALTKLLANVYLFMKRGLVMKLLNSFEYFDRKVSRISFKNFQFLTYPQIANF